MYNSSVVHCRTVVEVLDDHVVRIDQPVTHEKNESISKMVLLVGKTHLKDLMWSRGEGRVWIIGTVALGKNTSFTKDFSVIFKPIFNVNNIREEILSSLQTQIVQMQ